MSAHRTRQTNPPAQPRTRSRRSEADQPSCPAEDSQPPVAVDPGQTEQRGCLDSQSGVRVRVSQRAGERRRQVTAAEDDGHNGGHRESCCDRKARDSGEPSTEQERGAGQCGRAHDRPRIPAPVEAGEQDPGDEQLDEDDRAQRRLARPVLGTIRHRSCWLPPRNQAMVASSPSSRETGSTSGNSPRSVDVSAWLCRTSPSRGGRSARTSG